MRKQLTPEERSKYEPMYTVQDKLVILGSFSSPLVHKIDLADLETDQTIVGFVTDHSHVLFETPLRVRANTEPCILVDMEQPYALEKNLVVTKYWHPPVNVTHFLIENQVAKAIRQLNNRLDAEFVRKWAKNVLAKDLVEGDVVITPGAGDKHEAVVFSNIFSGVKHISYDTFDGYTVSRRTRGMEAVCQRLGNYAHLMPTSVEERIRQSVLQSLPTDSSEKFEALMNMHIEVLKLEVKA